ncbi:MAG TPA: adenosine monophosphate-protein transferase [Thermoprotei archaeon]|nr:adenosine monophosphate-protein transferase [Thermoprotei archaeon]
MVQIIVKDIEIPEGCSVIIGQAHFIKTVEDLYEALVGSAPNIEFGIAFCESSGPRLVRYEGNNEELKKIAIKNALEIAAGHAFIIVFKNAWPINVLNEIKSVPEVVNIFAATSNPLQVILVETKQGRGIIGVIDGGKTLGVESQKDIEERREFLRKIGYKLR